MKKLVFCGLFTAFTVFGYAQKADTVSNKSGIQGNNELRINLLNSIIGIPEINYERLIKDDMGIGLAAFIGLDDQTEYTFGVIPHFRVYFGGKKASGFFIEGNAAVIGTKDYDYINLAGSQFPTGYAASRQENNYTSLGLGAAAGAKFLTRNGFIGEVYGGVIRLFGDRAIEAYPRIGITIGKRF